MCSFHNLQPDSPAVFYFAVFAQINIGFVSKASNSEVRANAAILFVEAFPIRDPALTSEDADIVIQKQFEEIFVSMDHAFNPDKSIDKILVCGSLSVEIKWKWM